MKKKKEKGEKQFFTEREGNLALILRKNCDLLQKISVYHRNGGSFSEWELIELKLAILDKAIEHLIAYLSFKDHKGLAYDPLEKNIDEGLLSYSDPVILGQNETDWLRHNLRLSQTEIDAIFNAMPSSFSMKRLVFLKDLKTLKADLKQVSISLTHFLSYSNEVRSVLVGASLICHDGLRAYPVSKRDNNFSVLSIKAGAYAIVQGSNGFLGLAGKVPTVDLGLDLP